MYFTPNEGQWDEPIVAKCIFKGGAFFIRKDGFRLKMYAPDDLPNIHKAFHYRGKDTQFSIHGHVVDVKFAGSQPQHVAVAFEEEAQYYENYFLGNDAKQWKTGIYPVKRVRLKNVYPGIDFVIYTKGEVVEFDWIVQPGAKPETIQMEFDGQDSFQFINHDIVAKTSVGDFIVKRPLVRQSEKAVLWDYLRIGHGSSFVFAPWGIWDSTKPIIIDPILIFSTYSGSRGDNFGFTATYDTSGHLYAGGIMDIDQGTYPITTGAFQTVYGGRGPAVAPVYLPCDVAISKYKPDGSSLVYASYLGGKSNEYPHSLGIDEKNNLLVLGTTLSSDFPVNKITAFDTGFNGKHDIYIAKIKADGTAILGCTFLGGPQDDGINTGTLHYNYADDFRGDIICDPKGNVYIATCTRSTNFPVSPNAAQSTLQAGLEAVVLSLNPTLNKLRWSTFVGGTEDDAAYSIKLDDSLNVFVGGGTASLNFPTAGKPMHSNYLGGRADGFVMKLTNDSGKFTASTYWGTNGYEQISFLDFDVQDHIYATGQTEGNLIRTAGTYGKNNTTQFIARFNNSLDSQELVTTFGNRTGLPELSPCAFMVDKCYNIYFSGWGSEIGVGNAGTTEDLQITSDAYQKTTDNNDFYLIVLGRDAKSLIYATYFGGNASEDHVDGGTSRFDKRGIIYQSVCSSCPNQPPGLNDFPTTATSAFPVNVSYRCSNASFKLDFKITYAVEAKFTAQPISVCTPDTVFFMQVSTFGKSFFWDFGDGSTSKQTNPFHIYTIPGKYTVKLIARDSGSCNVVDSMTREIDVRIGPEVTVDITTQPCESEVSLEISGKNYANPVWDLGDGNTATTNKVKHNYLPGSYNPKVVVINPATGCKDSFTKNVVINKDSTNEIFLANVFTPNNDTKNDCYKVIGLAKECDEAELRIFNRWGEKLFETKDLNLCWNGRVNTTGAELPEGTYFYQLFIKNKSTGHKKTIAGSINLIR